MQFNRVQLKSEGGETLFFYRYSIGDRWGVQQGFALVYLPEDCREQWLRGQINGLSLDLSTFCGYYLPRSSCHYPGLFSLAAIADDINVGVVILSRQTDAEA